jgi:hypothetical protein
MVWSFIAVHEILIGFGFIAICILLVGLNLKSQFSAVLWNLRVIHTTLTSRPQELRGRGIPRRHGRTCPKCETSGEAWTLPTCSVDSRYAAAAWSDDVFTCAGPTERWAVNGARPVARRRK